MRHTVFYNTDYVACGYEFETTRKSADIAESLTGHPLVAIKDPKDFYFATDSLINEIHSPEYVNAVKTGEPVDLAESQGFSWDENIYLMARAHNAGVVAATAHVLQSGEKIAGTLSSGLHHSRREHGEGFCTFNGLSAAAKYALSEGVGRILILDFDAHCGGGTRLTTNEKKVIQVDVSTSTYDVWGVANDSDMLKITRASNYITDISEALDYATSLGNFDLVLYNAGMDPANNGVSFSDLATREEMVANWIMDAGFPLIYTMAGGYLALNITEKDIVSLHRLTIDAFALA